MLTIMRGVALAVPITLTMALTAYADVPMCRNGNFASTYAPETLRLARVKATTGLYRDFYGCPMAGEKCRMAGTIQAGSMVLAAPAISGGWVCVFMPPSKGRSDTAGYLRNDSLMVEDTSRRQERADFIGLWERAPNDNRITIKSGRASGALTIHGDGFWPSKADPQHTGLIKGEATPVNGRFRIVDRFCDVSFNLLGSYLFVNDTKSG